MLQLELKVEYQKIAQKYGMDSLKNLPSLSQAQVGLCLAGKFLHPFWENCKIYYAITPLATYWSQSSFVVEATSMCQLLVYEHPLFSANNTQVSMDSKGK